MENPDSIKIDISKIVQYHNGIEHFNYDLTIDWALDLMNKGIETKYPPEQIHLF